MTEPTTNTFGVTATTPGGAKVCYHLVDGKELTKDETHQLVAWLIVQAQLPVDAVAETVNAIRTGDF